MIAHRLLFPPLVACIAACGSEPRPQLEAVRRVEQAATVDDVLGTSCATSSVKGLSEQIVAQGNCIAPGAFVAVPDQPNVAMGMSVFPYLEEPARDAFVASARADPGTTLGVNSMLRTVAQQYLLYSWYQAGSCGIGLAAEPGSSNHETGLAFDTSDYAAWKPTLADHGFAWLGNSDPVHFDYAGADAKSYKGTDVLAFQQLWNANNPGDPIAEDGDYGPETAARLGASPAEGFALGADCGSPPAGPDLYPSIDGADLEDRFADGASADVPDLFAGDEVEVAFTLENKGGASAEGVVVGLEVASAYAELADYVVETDRTHPGTFETDDANADPQNPSHGESLASPATLKLGPVAVGEKKRVRATVRATDYSLDGKGPPGAFVRGWVIDVPGVYHQPTFDSQPDTDGSQTYRGGQRLTAARSLDVYDHARWEWDTDRLEGWAAPAALDRDAGALVLPAGARALGPTTALDASALRSIEIRLSCAGSPPKIAFSTDGAEPDDAHVLEVAVPADGAVHSVTLDAGAHGGWAGTVTRLALVAGGSASVEHLAVVDGVVAPAAAADEEGTGCSCTAAGRTPTSVARGGGAAARSATSRPAASSTVALLLLATAVAAHARRRRRAPSC